MSSNKGKVSIQESSNESDMEIEFERAHSGGDISGGDAKCLFCTGRFSHEKLGEIWARMCEVLSLGACRLWG
jgi:hypothetical protein